MTKTETELKPCPFCNGEMELVHLYSDPTEHYEWSGYILTCTDCHASWAFPDVDEEEAVFQWNNEEPWTI